MQNKCKKKNVQNTRMQKEDRKFSVILIIKLLLFIFLLNIQINTFFSVLWTLALIL